MFDFLKKKEADVTMCAIASGKCIPLEEVNDPVFSSKAMGDGVAVVPSECTIVAPCDGTIAMLAKTLHAFGMTREDGLEIMVHVGIDTVALNGEGFTALKSEGSTVKKGEPVIKYDAKVMEEKGLDMTTMLILLNQASYKCKMLAQGQDVKAGTDTVIECQN